MNQPRPPLRMVALFPHEDAARPLRMYRSRLFAAGFLGAFSFPLCAPLAVLTRPLRKDELAAAAADLRAAASRVDSRGRLVAAGSVRIGGDGFPPRLALPLSVPVPALPGDAVLSRCAEVALVLAVLDGPPADEALPAPPEGAAMPPFRPAYLANVAVRTAESGEAPFSYEWETGEPRWLPGGAR